MSKRLLWCISIAFTLSLLLLGACYGGWEVPKGQPAQIKSPVNYDPNLSDPFFESEERSHPWWICKRPDGTIENTMGGPSDEKKLPRLKHTAKCFISFHGKHWINFCDAKLLDGNATELFIHHMDAGTNDNLRIVIQNGAFWSQYWTDYKRAFHSADKGLRWTTKKQELTLNKQVYRKGDVVKGKIVIESA